MFYKHLLGMSKTTTTKGILLDLGTVHLMLSVKKSVIKNWERIRNGNSNILVSSSKKNAIIMQLNWTEKIKTFKSEITLLDYFINLITLRIFSQKI